MCNITHLVEKKLLYLEPNRHQMTFVFSHEAITVMAVLPVEKFKL